MFSELVDVVFPAIGDFFGILTAVAIRSPSWWLNSLELVVSGVNDSIALTYGNYFTGLFFGSVGVNVIEIPLGLLSGTLVGTIGWSAIVSIVTPFFNVFINAPLWIALPCAFAEWSILLSFARWIFGFFNRD